MKKLLYLGIIGILASCGSSTVNVNGREISTIKIGDLEVMTEDLSIEISVQEQKEEMEERNKQLSNDLTQAPMAPADINIAIPDGAPGSSSHEQKETILETPDGPIIRNKMNWDKAKKACESLGYGWRLPTEDELYLMQDNKEMIGGFEEKGHYWSSEVREKKTQSMYDDYAPTLINHYAGMMTFNREGFFEEVNTDASGHVRAVRSSLKVVIKSPN